MCMYICIYMYIYLYTHKWIYMYLYITYIYLSASECCRTTSAVLCRDALHTHNEWVMPHVCVNDVTHVKESRQNYNGDGILATSTHKLESMRMYTNPHTQTSQQSHTSKRTRMHARACTRVCTHKTPRRVPDVIIYTRY